MIILIMWDMFETYSEPSDHWKLFFEITFSKTSAWKWIKIRFLAYCDFIKAITNFLSLETKSLHTYGLDTDDIEGCEFSKEFRAETIVDTEKTNGMRRTLKSSKLFENPIFKVTIMP